MGGGDNYGVWESLEMDRKSDFGVPDGNITWDVTKIEDASQRAMAEAGVKVMLRARAVDVVMTGSKVEAVVLADGTKITGDAFVDATGSCGSIEMCQQYGQGCGLCVLKCPMYGDRVSITAKAGVPDVPGQPGYIHSNLIDLQSLSPQLRRQVEETSGGYCYLPVPEELYRVDMTEDWPRPETAFMTRWHHEEIEIINVHFAKTHLVMPLKYIHRIPGFEDAWMITPQVSTGEPISSKQPAPHDNTLLVKGLDNIFAGGLRAGAYSSGQPAMFTGELAGHNAARKSLGRELLELPLTTIQGFFIAKVNKSKTPTEWPPHQKPDVVFEQNGFTVRRVTDYQRIKESIVDAGLVDVYQRKLA